eukprot:1578312-Amphidinium_carterae.1
MKLSPPSSSIIKRLASQPVHQCTIHHDCTTGLLKFYVRIIVCGPQVLCCEWGRGDQSAGIKGYHKQKFFDTMLKYRMPPDDIYAAEVRSKEDLEALAQAGDRDFNLLHTDAWLEKNQGQYCKHPTKSKRTPACAAAISALIEHLQPTVTWLQDRGCQDPKNAVEAETTTSKLILL